MNESMKMPPVEFPVPILEIAAALFVVGLAVIVAVGVWRMPSVGELITKRLRRRM